MRGQDLAEFFARLRTRAAADLLAIGCWMWPPLARGRRRTARAARQQRWKDLDAIEAQFERVIATEPTSDVLARYANFLAWKRNDLDRAEELFRRAVDADPDSSATTGAYAHFLSKHRGDFDRADEFFRRAVDADPENANNLGNYAIFLENQRKDFDRAERFFGRAIDADPNHATNLGNYAIFLGNQRKDFDRAERFFGRAIDANPNNATNLGNYANFLAGRRDLRRAERFYRRAISADPGHATNMGNYAVFLFRWRRDSRRAERFFKRAIDTAPGEAVHVVNYAGFLCADGRTSEALALTDRVLAKPGDRPLHLVCRFYQYMYGSDDSHQIHAGLVESARLVRDGVRAPEWDLLDDVGRLRADRHPEPELLAVLAYVITADAPADTLNAFPAWQDAVAALGDGETQ